MGKTMIVPMTTTEMVEVPVPPTDLPFDDGENMDSPWHRAQMDLLIQILETHWKGRNFYCGGNMFVHFSSEQVRNSDFRGPDFFVVLNVDHDKPRLYWAVWEENGRYPDLILELLSPTTAKEDRGRKKDIYEQTFRTSEYLLYDPETEKLEGWRLQTRYRPIAVESGRVWCEALELWLGPWKGTWEGHEAIWLRFFDRDGNMLPTEGEKEALRANAAEAEAERLRKELEALRQQSSKNKP
jgi:Uma2 family endonuclease